MKNALILHGTANNAQGNWFPWLKTKLERRSWKVWVPDLPQADRPNTKRYNQFILGNKDWQFDKETVIIGHSSGAVAILGLLHQLPTGVKIDTCILVSAFKDNLGSEIFNGLFEEPFDFEKIRQKANNFILVYSDNDPYVPLEHGRWLAQQLNAKLIIKPGQGHFNLETGPEYKQFPLILELLGEK